MTKKELIKKITNIGYSKEDAIGILNRLRELGRTDMIGEIKEAAESGDEDKLRIIFGSAGWFLKW